MNNIIPYKASGIWGRHDFKINKFFWKKYGFKASYHIRERNLIDVQKVFNMHKVKVWLQGNTLKGIYETGMLLCDHDDDLGVAIEDSSLIYDLVYSKLSEIGFSVIRDSKDMISIERDYRYIDICFFKDRAFNRVGYANKLFKKCYYLHFENIYWNDVNFLIPVKTKELLINMYPASRVLKVNKKIQEGFLKIIHKRGKALGYAKQKFRGLIQLTIKKNPAILKSKYIRFLSLIGVGVKSLSEDDFLNLKIEPEDSFNWGWRKRHLNLVTNNGKYIYIKDIIKYLSNNNSIQDIKRKLEVTDTKKVFFDPVNYDMDFWWTGNNFFWFCIRYQFRKNVQPYSRANLYIKKNKTPLIYTKDYYRSLPKMSEKDVRSFLSKGLIEIENGSIVGGKHRAFAMIGRMLDSKEYIPFMAIDL